MYVEDGCMWMMDVCGGWLYVEDAACGGQLYVEDGCILWSIATQMAVCGTRLWRGCTANIYEHMTRENVVCENDCAKIV